MPGALLRANMLTRLPSTPAEALYQQSDCQGQDRRAAGLLSRNRQTIRDRIDPGRGEKRARSWSNWISAWRGWLDLRRVPPLPSGSSAWELRTAHRTQPVHGFPSNALTYWLLPADER